MGVLQRGRSGPAAALVRRTVVLAIVATLGLGARAGSAADLPTPLMYTLVASLEGDWHGIAEWSEGRTGSYELDLRYRLTGGGSAVVEDWLVKGRSTMMSVYHLDDGDLRMTHYCGAQNQPRLRATKFDETGIIEFSFVDVTNAGEHPAYVQAATVKVLSEDRLEVVLRFGGPAGPVGVETLRMQRVPGAP
jgi:hypothetical protein